MTDYAKLRIRSQLAMEIAGVDRLRFNEAVNAGNYPCAPAGQRGKPRTFSETDVIGLFLFGKLMSAEHGLGMTVASAGTLTCRLMTYLEEHNSAHGKPYSERQIVLVVGQLRSFFVKPSEFDPHMNHKGRFYQAHGKILFSLNFDLENVRKIIREHVEEELLTVGRGDDEAE